jgi:hypothetical protein
VIDPVHRAYLIASTAGGTVEAIIAEVGVPQSLDQERTLRINLLSGRGLQRP